MLAMGRPVCINAINVGNDSVAHKLTADKVIE
jgi:hypothetical protein